jgi:hypothetical protein
MTCKGLLQYTDFSFAFVCVIMISCVQAFFTPEYMEAHPEDAALITKLQDLIASQIPLLDLCIHIHRQRAPPSLGPFQQRLEECFAEMQNHVESKYGKKVTEMQININTGEKVHQWNT